MTAIPARCPTVREEISSIQRANFIAMNSVQSTETLHFLHTHPANNAWLAILTIRGREFIKINRQKSINAIIDGIQRDLQEQSSEPLSVPLVPID